MNLLTPEIGLLIWQVLILTSLVLSVLIIIQGARSNDSRLLLFGVVSILIPIITTIPYFLFSRKSPIRFRKE